MPRICSLMDTDCRRCRGRYRSSGSGLKRNESCRSSCSLQLLSILCWRILISIWTTIRRITDDAATRDPLLSGTWYAQSVYTGDPIVDRKSCFVFCSNWIILEINKRPIRLFFSLTSPSHRHLSCSQSMNSSRKLTILPDCIAYLPPGSENGFFIDFSRTTEVKLFLGRRKKNPLLIWAATHAPSRITNWCEMNRLMAWINFRIIVLTGNRSLNLLPQVAAIHQICGPEIGWIPKWRQDDHAIDDPFVWQRQTVQQKESTRRETFRASLLFARVLACLCVFLLSLSLRAAHLCSLCVDEDGNRTHSEIDQNSISFPWLACPAVVMETNSQMYSSEGFQGSRRKFLPETWLFHHVSCPGAIVTPFASSAEQRNCLWSAPPFYWRHKTCLSDVPTTAPSRCHQQDS